MSTHNILHDKIRKFPKIFVFLGYRKNFVGTQKRVRISHGKRAIGVRAIGVRLYFFRKDNILEQQREKTYLLTCVPNSFIRLRCPHEETVHPWHAR